MTEQEKTRTAHGQVSAAGVIKTVVVFIILLGIALWGSDWLLNSGNASASTLAVVTVALVLAASGTFSVYLHYPGLIE